SSVKHKYLALVVLLRVLWLRVTIRRAQRLRIRVRPETVRTAQPRHNRRKGERGARLTSLRFMLMHSIACGFFCFVFRLSCACPESDVYLTRLKWGSFCSL